MADKSADFKNLFKAAKSARGGQKLTKEQIKQLKAQKAAAAAAEEAQQRARPPVEGQPANGGTSSGDDARSMPPPPPRQPSAAARSPPAQPAAGAASYHADSQATRLNYGGGAVAPSAQPEPSVNQGGGALHHPASRSTGVGASEEVHSSHPEGLPANFFQSVGAGATSAGASTSPPRAEGASGSGAGVARGPAGAAAQAAMSREGSTGAIAGQDAPGGDLTSNQRTAGTAQPSAISGVPEGFFEAALSAGAANNGPSAMDADAVTSSPAAGAGAAAGLQQAGAAALPKGFFQDKAADAKARGEVPKSKKDMDEELADFLKQVDVDAAAAAAHKAAEDAADAADKEDREEFEHIVRLQRIEELKKAKAAGAGAAAPQQDELVASAAVALSNPEISMPTIKLPKKRKVADTVAELERESMSEGESSDEEGAEELLDWRAKKSAF